MIKKLIGLALIMLSTNSIAQEVKALVLSKDLAILTINGKKQRFKIGQTIEGVTLIAADTQQASIKINDETKTIKLGSSTVYQSEKPAEIIYKNPIGMFVTTASINGGKEKTAIIDRTVSTVAISQKTAVELKIDYKKGLPVKPVTGAGKITRRLVTLDSIKIGKIEIKNIFAVVTEQDTDIVLIGNSFLDKTRIIVNKNNIVLTKR